MISKQGQILKLVSDHRGELPPLGLKKQSECVKVSFDIGNIHVVVAERWCKGGILETLQKSGIS